MSSPEVVTVVLGAGASYAVSDGLSPTTELYRPPLTRALFDFNARPWVGDIARNLPGVVKLHSDLARAAQSGERGLEQALQDLANHRVPERRRWYRDVPPFLQAQIYAVSRQYLSLRVNSLPASPGGGNYQKLVNDLFHSGTERQVVFITLNYDDYLEQSLAIAGDPIRSMRDYADPGRSWRMVKLHGSINWFVDLSSAWEKSDQDFPRNWQQALFALDSGTYDKTVEVHPDIRDVWSSGPPYRYPVLTVPVATKDQRAVVCPKDQGDCAVEWLRRSKRTLVIGTSGHDEDLGAFLKEALPPQELVHVVTKGKDGASRELKDRLLPYIPVKEDTSAMQVFQQGFNDYLHDGSFHSFLGLVSPPKRGLV